MSKFTVEAFLFKLAENRELVAAFIADADEVLARFPMTDDERRALRAWDVRGITDAGVSPMITMFGYTAVHGMEGRSEYIRRMKNPSFVSVAA